MHNVIMSPPELSVGMQTEGVDIRSVGNTQVSADETVRTFVVCAVPS